MDLRVSLLIIGGIIILAIYLISRRNLPTRERHASIPRASRWSDLWQSLRDRLQITSRLPQQESYTPAAPVLDASELEQLEAIVPDRGAGGISTEEMPVILELGSEQIAPAGEQLFIPLTILARQGQQLNGEVILHAASVLGLVLKDDGIYRYEVKDAQGYRQALLGLVNILEPGTFSPEQMDQFSTPGLVLYLHLPAPLEAREAFDKLVEIGRKLEELLEAELCDETRSVLTRQTIGHLREKIEAFRFKQKMTSLQSRRP